MGIENEFIEFKARVEAILPTLATKADVESMRADITRRMLATVIGLFLGFAGLFMAMGNLFWHMPPAQAQQTSATASCQPCAAAQVVIPQEKSPR